MKVKSLRHFESKIIFELKSHIQSFPFDKNIKYCGYQQDPSLSQPELKPIGNNCYKIFLTKNTAKNDIQSIYQIAHELVHQIAPVKRELINYFEEGLATWFQIDFVKRNLPYAPDNNGKIYYLSAIELMQNNRPKYFQALQDINLLIKQSEESIWTIALNILKLKQNFSEINIVDLNNLMNFENNDLFKRLCNKFYE